MSDLLPYIVKATHIEFHDHKSDKFWRSYVFEDAWVAHWGPCSAPVGQYKLFVTDMPAVAATEKYREKCHKGYGYSQTKTWAVTEGFHAAILKGEGLNDLGIRFDELLGMRQLPVADVIAGLQAIVADLG